MLHSDADQGHPLNHEGSRANHTSIVRSSKGTSLETVRNRQKVFFQQQKTKSFAFRDHQLRILGEAIKAHEEQLIEAMAKDLSKPKLEAYGTEIGFIYAEIKHTRRQLAKWMRPQKVRGHMLVFPGSSKILSEPLGQVLIISPWNYPFQLCIAPLIGAIAAGNCVVLKPSELTPNTSGLVRKILVEVFPEEYVAVFEGGADMSRSLLEDHWDHIFFTGSTRVGRLVAMAAARHLSPVTLELGGKSPAIVHKDANLNLAAKRIAWGKFCNTGQTCVAPDYILVHKDVMDELVALIIKHIEKFFGPDPQKSQDYGRLVTKEHCERLSNMLDEGRVVTGGVAKVDQRYLAPTIVDGVRFSSKVMQEEIFGPILPVIAYEDLGRCLAKMLEMDKPLALYLFTTDTAVMRQVENEVPFGGGCINDTLMHLANPALPFGGIGTSGSGAYHGKYSFDVFSHKKSLLVQSSWFDLPVRYPPYSDWKLKIFRSLMNL